MAFGRVGEIASVSVSVIDDPPGIDTVSVEQVAGNAVVIRWKSFANDNRYDHFIVMRETPASRSLVAATHAVGSNGTHELRYQLAHGDVGTMRFSVIPVFSDYSVGNKVTSPDILVVA
jgi:hypothetical protein